jgi:CubicO group peptidase (beta-lactamase class C family)
MNRVLLNAAALIFFAATNHLFADDEIPPPPLQAPEAAPRQYHYRIPTALSDGWKTGDLRKENIDLDLLSWGMDRIWTGGIPDVDSLLVLRHGRIVLDEYFRGRGAADAHALNSCTKSVFSTVFGIAQDQGLLNLNEKIYDYYPEERSKAGWDSRKNSITAGMLLSMTSGLDCDDAPATGGFGCGGAMGQSPDWLNFCFVLPLAQTPGTSWTYNGSSLVLLSNRIARRSGMSFADYAGEVLLSPLGIPPGTWVTGPNGVTRVDYGLAWKPRDMAKLGQLYLNKGTWEGKRIVSEAWVKTATTAQAPLGRAFGHDYGYLWHIKNMEYKGREVRVFFANGYQGQAIFVSPDADLVCVITADSNDGQIYGDEENLFESAILGCFK